MLPRAAHRDAAQRFDVVLGSRYLLRDAVQARFGKRLAPINEGLKRDGVWYLLTLRLVPLFPFWLINLLMGLTAMPAGRFYLASQLGMLAGTVVYVNAGTQLGSITGLGDVLSLRLWGSFVLLGLFPLLARYAVESLRMRKRHAGWKKPARFDRNLVVIGAGSGGLVSAYIAAAVKAKVTLVESHRMGGDCLNTGCVPSKALIRSAKLMRHLRDAERFGIVGAGGTVDFAAVMRRVSAVIRTIEPHDSAARYTGLGVEVLQGHARITSPWQVDVALGDGGEGAGNGAHHRLHLLPETAENRQVRPHDLDPDRRLDPRGQHVEPVLDRHRPHVGHAGGHHRPVHLGHDRVVRHARPPRRAARHHARHAPLPARQRRRRRTRSRLR